EQLAWICQARGCFDCDEAEASRLTVPPLRSRRYDPAAELRQAGRGRGAGHVALAVPGVQAPVRRAEGAAMRLGEAVRIEVRAASIAAGMIHSLSHDMSDEELVGWMRRGDGSERGTYPKSHAWQAGWL